MNLHLKKMKSELSFSFLLLSFQLLIGQSNRIQPLTLFVLSHEVTASTFLICEQKFDTIYLVTDSIILRDTLVGILCDATLINIQGK